MTARLLAELDRVTRSDPHGRKLLVGSRPAEGRELLRSLARGGRPWLGWEAWSLRQLAHATVALDLARAGLRTADAFDVMALVDHAIDRAGAARRSGPFPGGVPGAYRDPIRRTIETLRLAGMDAARMAGVARGDGKLRLLAAILAAYEAELAARSLVDGAGLLTRATDALLAASSPPPPLADAALFLLPGLGLRGVEGRLVRALLDRAGAVLETDPVARLQPPGGRLWAASPDGGPLSGLHDAGTGSPARPDLDLFAAATPGDELREVLRRVVAVGVPWDQVEIVATDTATYGVALDGLARRLGIPVTHSDGLPLSRTRVGRAADAYFRWIGDGFPVDPIRHLLESGDLAPPATASPPSSEPGATGAGESAEADGAAETAEARGDPTPLPPPSPSSLARRLRRLGIGWGYDRYLPAVDRSLSAVDRAGPPRHGDGDEETARLARDRERAELEALRSLLAPILAATPRPAVRQAVWGGRTSPARLAEGLLALLARVPAGDAVENTARTVLVERLERARATLTRETGWLAATGILRARLDTRIAATSDAARVSPWTSAGGHLHLSGVAMGGLAARPHTFVVGLAAGAVAAGAGDPLLADTDRSRLNGAIGSPGGGRPPLASAAERTDEARHALAAMLARLRGRVTLSYAAWDAVEGRTIGPAPELLQALRLRDGDAALTYDDLRRLLGRLACAVPAPDDPPGARLDAADVWLAALATPDGRLRDGRDTVRALYPGLDRGLEAAETRAGDVLTAYHGVVPPDPLLDPVASGVALSASRLEKLGKCPLEYFYRFVLGAHPVRDPEYDAERWLDALERGLLLHGVYERTLGERPADADFADASFLGHALAVLDDEVARTLHRLPAPNEAVLRAERAALEADVRSFVAMVREARPRVDRTELAFGPGPDSDGEVEIEVRGGMAELGELGDPGGGATRGGRLRLRGRVDRLDVLEGGGLRVVDYKTGQPRRYHRAVPFDGGRRLQHFLYPLAVERLRPDARVASSEYHFPTVRGENRVVAFPRPELDAGHDVLATLLDLARHGRFLATTDPDDCRFCDFRAVCRVSIGDWNKVASARAEWARAHAPGFAEYRPLVRLRTEYGSGS